MSMSVILCLSARCVCSEEKKMADDECLEDQMEKICRFQVVKLVLLIMLCKYLVIWFLQQTSFIVCFCVMTQNVEENAKPVRLPCEILFLL